MDRIFQVVKREYLERVRNKWFFIATILGPGLLMAMMFIPAMVITKGAEETTCAVLDETGYVFEALEARLAGDRTLKSFTLVAVEPIEGPVEHYKAAITAGTYDSFLFIPADLLETNEAQYYARGVGFATEMLPRVLTAVVTQHLLTAEGLDPDRIDELTRRVGLDAYQVGKTGEAEKKEFGAVYFLTFILVMMLYVTILSYGGIIMNSTVQEKSNRVMEVLVAKASPFELLVGKLVGNGAAGLTQFIVWATMGAVLVGMGAPAMATADLDLAVEPIVFVWFVIFFLLGFFTMSAAYAAVGSMCNSPQETQQMQFPLILPLLAALMITFLVIAHPDAPAGVILSFVPFISPIVMFARVVVQTPPLWQLLLAVAINVGAILATTWVAARIYRIGILMYGKRPTIPEMLRWVGAT